MCRTCAELCQISAGKTANSVEKQMKGSQQTLLTMFHMSHKYRNVTITSLFMRQVQTKSQCDFTSFSPEWLKLRKAKVLAGIQNS